MTNGDQTQREEYEKPTANVLKFATVPILSNDLSPNYGGNFGGITEFSFDVMEFPFDGE